MKAVVLASGGLDSTVTAAVAKGDGCRVYLLTISYGQRHRVEVERARQIAMALGAAGGPPPPRGRVPGAAGGRARGAAGGEGRARRGGARGGRGLPRRPPRPPP